MSHVTCLPLGGELLIFAARLESPKPRTSDETTIPITPCPSERLLQSSLALLAQTTRTFYNLLRTRMFPPKKLKRSRPRRNVEADNKHQGRTRRRPKLPPLPGDLHPLKQYKKMMMIMKKSLHLKSACSAWAAARWQSHLGEHSVACAPVRDTRARG